MTLLCAICLARALALCTSNDRHRCLLLHSTATTITNQLPTDGSRLVRCYTSYYSYLSQTDKYVSSNSCDIGRAIDWLLSKIGRWHKGHTHPNHYICSPVNARNVNNKSDRY